MASGTTELMSATASTFMAGFSNSWVKWVFIVLAVVLVVGGIAWVWKSNRKEKMKWNKTFRIYRADPRTNKIPLDPYIIKASGVTIKGTKYIYLKEKLLGSRIMPLLNYYTKPGTYDLLVTPDNRFFLLDGITGVDKQRKQLGVGLRYPGIDYAFDDINKDYAKMNDVSGFDRTMEMIKKISQVVLPIIILIALIVGGNYYVQASESDAIKSQAELELMEIMLTASINYEESGDTMVVVLDQIKDITGTNNVKSHIDLIKAEESQ